MIQTGEQLLKELTDAHERCLIKLNGKIIKKSGPLYHYTDLSGALSILEKSSLRFTDIKYCNDPDELENGLNIFNKVTNDIFNFYFKKSPQFIHVMSYIRHYLNLSTSFKEREEQLIKNDQAALAKFGIDASQFVYHKTSTFISCLSERGDDLRQWLPYANDGKGVALGFQGFNETHNLTAENIWIIKVCYESIPKKEQYVIDLFENLFNVFVNMNLDLLQPFVVAIHDGILHDIIACKSENYKDEEEWRLLRTSNVDSVLEKMNFRIKDNILRPYIEVPIVKDSLLEVKLGPKVERNLNAHALNVLLEKNSYSKTKITNSVISYR